MEKSFLIPGMLSTSKSIILKVHTPSYFYIKEVCTIQTQSFINEKKIVYLCIIA
jgi:hypothetical protein